MHPEDGAAVEAGSHETALGQEQAGQVGQVGMVDASHPVCVRVRQGREQVRQLRNHALKEKSSAQRARGVPLTVRLLPGWPQRCWRHGRPRPACFQRGRRTHCAPSPQLRWRTQPCRPRTSSSCPSKWPQASPQSPSHRPKTPCRGGEYPARYTITMGGEHPLCYSITTVKTILL